MNNRRKTLRQLFICFGGMLLTLFLGAVALIYEWPIIYIIGVTFLFAFFLIIAVYIYVSETGQSQYDKLKAEKELVEQESAHKTEYFANMAHDIRTPINAIMGYNELILREYNDPALRQYASNIRSAANSLLTIVNDSLDYSRIEAGKMTLLPIEYDLGIMIEELINMIRPAALSKGLDFQCHVNENIPVRLYGDVDRLKQCIMNLLTNAVKYTQEGEIGFSVDYEPTAYSINSSHGEIMLCVSVKDTGIGIKEEDITRLYRPFERIDEEKNRSVEGTGLGIAIVKRILGIMDSKLEVDSTYGEGSNFYFKVRQEVVRKDPIGNFEQQYVMRVVDQRIYGSRFIAPDARVLIVDDAEMNLSVMEGLLKNTRIQVDSALSARTGLDLAYENDYDIIFIDLKMPGITGMGMVDRLRNGEGRKFASREQSIIRTQNDSNEEVLTSRNANTTCIALTADTHKEAPAEYLDAGFSDYLIKPIVYKELENVLLRFLPSAKIKRTDNKGVDTPSLMSDEKLDEAIEILKRRSRK